MAVAGLPNAISIVAVLFSVTMFIVAIAVYMNYRSQRKKDRYLTMRKIALSKNIPIIKVVDLAGNAISVLGTVDNQESIYFKDKRLSLKVRPSWLDTAEPIIEDGIRTYYYRGNWYYPAGAIGLSCLLDVVDNVNDKFPELNFLKDDLAIITSICVDKGEQLKYNCEQLLKDYEQEEYLYVDGELVQEVEYSDEYELLDENQEEMVNSDGEPIKYYLPVPKFDCDGNPVYKKNPNYLDADKLLSIMKMARSSILSMSLRPGYINIKRAMSLIPGKADGKNVDTLIKIELDKDRAKRADENKVWLYISIIAVAMAIMILGCYTIYILFPNAASVMG